MVKLFNSGLCGGDGEWHGGDGEWHGGGRLFTDLLLLLFKSPYQIAFVGSSVNIPRRHMSSMKSRELKAEREERKVPREDYFGCEFFYGKRNEPVYWSVLLELQRLQVILQDLQHLQAILQDLQHLKAILRDLQEMQSAQTASTCLER
ncbi:hypothetical protein Tco_1343191 [Tanacetum coccineum]